MMNPTVSLSLFNTWPVICSAGGPIFLPKTAKKNGDSGMMNYDEFTVHEYNKQQLLELWENGWNCFLTTLESLKKKDLKKTVHIRKEPLSVIDAINRQLAHYPYHIGQIIYIAKIIKNTGWKNLSIPKGESQAYNSSTELKDPAKKFS